MPEELPPPEHEPKVPHFGELQAKIDAHPLFSGVSSPPPKRRSRLRQRVLWPLFSILLLLSVAYLAIDSGIVRTDIKMPFHVFRQPVSVTPPSIQSGR